MLLYADEEAATAALASGVLACPLCKSGRLRSWGWGKERAVRMPGGTLQLRPRRSRCRSCGATHVLLPAWTVSRRADSTATIAATVRGWLRRLRERAGQLLQEASCEFGRLVAVIDDGAAIPPRPGRRDLCWATAWP